MTDHIEAAAKAAFRAAQTVYRADHDHFTLRHTWEATTEQIRAGWREIAAAAIAAPVPNGVPEGWCDMSTAPTDGTHILVRFDGTSSPPTVAHWFGPPPLPGLRAGGWYLSVQQFEGPQIHPTRWMPVPEDRLAASPVTPEGLSGGDAK